MRIFLHSLSFDVLGLCYQSHNIAAQEELDQYCQRAILLASKNDLVILASQPDTDYLNYLSFLGFGLGIHLVADGQGDSLIHKVLNNENLISYIKGIIRNERKLTLYPYYSGDDEWEFAGIIGAAVSGGEPSLTSDLNNKIYTRKFFLNLDISLPEGTPSAGSLLADTVSDYFGRYNAVIVRGERSCGGSSVWLIKSQSDCNEFKKMASQLNAASQFLVERYYETAFSPNYQFLINTNGIIFVGASEQILDSGMSHIGNRFPPDAAGTDTIHKISKQICNALKDIGYQGLIGIDYIVDINGGVMPVELNARFNTSSFAFIVMRKLFGAHWKAKKFELLHSLVMPNVFNFKDLQAYLPKDILFCHSKGIGVFPYNTGLLKWNKCDMIIIGDSWEQVTKLRADVTGLHSSP